MKNDHNEGELLESERVMKSKKKNQNKKLGRSKLQLRKEKPEFFEDDDNLEVKEELTIDS